MRIGFTGTQKGMTEKQRDVLWECLKPIAAVELCSFHHGDCIGADEEAASLATSLGFVVVVHPPVDVRKRVYTKKYSKCVKAKPYLERNRDIVNDTKVLFATPKENHEVLRSGTWSTIRYAIKLGIEVIIVYPDGVVETKRKI